MTPYQSAGGGTGVEVRVLPNNSSTMCLRSQDSYILAGLLSSPNCSKASIPNVTEVYDYVRCGPANEVAELSRIAGTLLQLSAPRFESVVQGDTSLTADQLRVVFETLGRMWAPLTRESLEDSRERAVTMLQERCAKVNFICFVSKGNQLISAVLIILR